MKTSILQLLDDKPLRLVESEDPTAAARPVQCAALSPTREHSGLGALLISIFLVLSTYWAMVRLLG